MSGMKVKASFRAPKKTAAQKLKDRLTSKALRKGLTDAGKVYLRIAKSTVPKRTGITRKSMARKVKIYRSGVGVLIVGPRTNFKRTGVYRGRTYTVNPAKIFHLLEKGTSHSQGLFILKGALTSGRSGAKAAFEAAVRSVMATSSGE